MIQHEKKKKEEEYILQLCLFTLAVILLLKFVNKYRHIAHEKNK